MGITNFFVNYHFHGKLNLAYYQIKEQANIIILITIAYLGCGWTKRALVTPSNIDTVWINFTSWIEIFDDFDFWGTLLILFSLPYKLCVILSKLKARFWKCTRAQWCPLCIIPTDKEDMKTCSTFGFLVLYHGWVSEPRVSYITQDPCISLFLLPPWNRCLF